MRDFEHETARWPRFAPAATAAGVASLVSFAMAPHDRPPGAMNFYSTRRDGFSGSDRALAAAFASQAAVAFYGATRVANLRRALDTRDVIGQAKGILRERFGLSDDEAFVRPSGRGLPGHQRQTGRGRPVVDQHPSSGHGAVERGWGRDAAGVWGDVT